MKRYMLLAVLLTGGSCFLNGAVAQTGTSGKDSIYSAYEKYAGFPGDVDGWRKYLENNLRYPSKAVKKNIQGTVKVQMLVDSTGKVKEAKALNDPGGGLGAEAVRVIKEGPDWIPAVQRGVNVPYRFIQQITFQLL